MKTLARVGLIAIVVVTCAAWTGVAHGSEDHGNSKTVTFTEINHPDSDVDLDLGPTGLSPGDEQIFHATLQQKGRDVGDVYGVGTVVHASDAGLISQVVSTAVFPQGTFTLQLMFQMNFHDGPPATLRGAITGCTGVYRGATGQCVSTVIQDTDNNSITCKFG